MRSRDLEHQSLFSELQTLSGVGSFDWNLETNELHWSDHLFHIYGLEPTRKPIRLEDFLERLYPEDRDATLQAIQTAVDQTGRLQREERILRADGAVRLLESRGLVIRDDTGQATRFLGSCRDITEQRETERALKWQHDGLALLSDVAKELLARAKHPESWRKILERLAAHAGCDAFANFRIGGDQITLQTHGGFTGDAVAVIAKSVIEQHPFKECAATGHFLYLSADQLRENPQSGELFQHGIRACVCGPLADSKAVLGMVVFASTCRDTFTERELEFMAAASDVVSAAKARHRADLGLTASEARCQLVVEHAKIVIWESDRYINQFSYVTGSSEAFLGFDESQWREPGFWMRQLHPSDQQRAIKACQQAVEDCQDYRQEYRMIRSNGDSIWVEHVVKVLVEDQTVVGLRGAMLDITDRKFLEDKYLQAQKMEAVGTLTGGIAHDFNNLLAAIIANLENAKHRSHQLPGNERSNAILEPVNGALDAAERAASTVRQLLAFSRRDNSDQKPIDCNHVLNAATKLLSHALDASFSLQLDLCDTLPMAMGNAAQLEHVILNLCNNSRDAMPTGGEIVLSTSVRRQDLGESVVMRVSDSGCGMTEETMARMFEPFFSTKDVDHGTGLGLATCYAVVKQHEGVILCDSKPGQGTQFEIVLPAVERPRDEQPTKSTAADKHPSPEPLNVLVVDDEEAVLQAITALLKAHGIQASQASNGNDALQLLRASPPLSIDVVLLDRTMPGLDGWATLQEISRLRPSLPVILCSGNLRIEDQKPGDVPPAAVLQKPYTINQLTTVLQEVIRKPPQQTSH